MFIGPFEHHSNELPWRESIADVVAVPGGRRRPRRPRLPRGSELRRYADRPLRIGSFSAASNVTGILSDVAGDLGAAARARRAGVLGLRRRGALRRAVDGRHRRDVPQPAQAHRRARRRRASSSSGARCSPTGCPTCPAAAPSPTSTRSSTATSTTRSSARRAAPLRSSRRSAPAWSSSSRTPSGSTSSAPTRRTTCVGPWRRGSEEPTIEILGNLAAERLSIVSFVVRAPSGRHLHHNFVVTLLNDLFGIQARGGCSCAGPYGHRLLGIDLERSHEFEHEIAAGCEGIKPGWVRVNFNYFISEAAFGYVVDAVRLVARHGWRLLGDYRFDVAGGLLAPPRRPGRASAAAEPGLLRRRRRDGLPAPRRHRPGVGAGRLPQAGRGDHARCDPGRRRRRPPASARTSSTSAGSTSPAPAFVELGETVRRVRTYRGSSWAKLRSEYDGRMVRASAARN